MAREIHTIKSRSRMRSSLSNLRQLNKNCTESTAVYCTVKKAPPSGACFGNSVYGLIDLRLPRKPSLAQKPVPCGWLLRWGSPAYLLLGFSY